MTGEHPSSDTGPVVGLSVWATPSNPGHITPSELSGEPQVVTYGCHTNATTNPVASHEHRQVGLFTEDEVAGLTMPDGYKRSVRAWYAHLDQPVPG